MKRHSNKHQLRLISEISITPLLDLVLVLLFIFLLTAPLLRADKELLASVTPPPVAVPLTTTAASADDTGTAPLSHTPAETMVLLVNSDRSVTLNGAMLARADLPVSLKKIAQRSPGIGIEVRMHRDLPVQALMETMELLKAAGIQHTAVSSHADAP